jgi:hypothetical protein
MAPKRGSWVYWLFRVYALCVLAMAVLHIVAWATGLGCLHSFANYVLAIGVCVGFVPLLTGVGYSLLLRIRRKQQ